MKKFAASVGLIAVGATALHAAETSTLNSMQQTKAWSVQATLRGFYDDNADSQPNNGVETAGLEFSPSVNFGIVGEQTSFNVGYAFNARYYDKPLGGRSDNTDYSHAFDLDLSHAFNPRFDLALSESFVIGQEPDFLRDPAGTQRIDGDNIRNFASIDFNMAVTQLLGFQAGYKNSYYDYDDELTGPFVGLASNSGLLDRMEHAVHLDSRWTLSPQTVGILGYMYSQTDYLGDEQIGTALFSDMRNSQGHTFYVGADHTFNSTLSGMLKVGAQHFSYPNDPADESQWSPYLQGSLRYLLQTTTSLDLGVSYARTAANQGGVSSTSFIRDSETASVYGALKHELISKLFATLNATLQNSTYNAPGAAAFDGNGFLFYQMGFDLSYQFTPHFSGHVGYNYDKYDANVPATTTDYDRNRVYLGLTAGF